ncbi:MAG: hypothetical protein AAF170_17780 [Bacteroidota bacterium]
MAFTSQKITYTPLDAEGNAAAPVSVVCTVTPPNVDAETVTLSESSGIYTGYYTPTRNGTHEVEVVATFSGSLTEVKTERFS